MTRLHCLSRTSAARRPSAVVLFALLAQVAACQPEPVPESVPLNPSPAQPTDSSNPPAEPTDTPQVQTFPYALTSPFEDSGTGMPPPGSGNVIRGQLTFLSFGGPDFRYDAYVVTARKSGAVRIQSDVLESRLYPYGYGYPIELLTLEEGFELVSWASLSYQNALETGTAVLEQSVEAGHQYILVYKTFDAFTPLTYRLTLPPTLTVEGRIHEPPEPVSVSSNSTGLITRENPRPEALEHLKTALDARMSLH